MFLGLSPKNLEIQSSLTYTMLGMKFKSPPVISTTRARPSRTSIPLDASAISAGGRGTGIPADISRHYAGIDYRTRSDAHLAPAIELWLDHAEQFQVSHSHPDADEIRAVLETPSYYLHFKTLETLYELLECTRTGTLADSSHLHIGLSSGGPLAFLCVRANGTHSAGQRIRHQGCAASG